MRRSHLLAGFAAGLSLLIAPAAHAQESLAGCQFEVFGNAAVNANGVLRASSTVPGPFGGASVDLPDDFLFADLDVLSTQFNLTDDGAGVGSPRFQIALNNDADPEADGNVFVYLGTAPGFADPGDGVWYSSGNLIGSLDERFDTSQLVPGGQTSTYAEALAALGGAEVVEISVVVDGGGNEADGEQTVLFRDIRVNDCIAFDMDGDGVPDAIDRCPDSDLRLLVDINGDAAGGETTVPNKVDRFGCSIQDLVNHALEDADNHGQFVSAIAHLANNARKAGLLTAAQSNALKTAAARSGFGQGGDDDDDDDDGDDDDGDDDKGKGKNKNKGGKGKKK